MIDRIIVQCLTRTESLRWVEILRQQIKCARTSSALNVAHPIPPPHVSPPFILLTFWIRDALEDGRLSLSNIKDLTQHLPDNLCQERPLSPWRYRRVKNEMFIEPSTKREALIKDQIVEEEDNPYGYIRYMSEHDSNDEFTILYNTIPSQNVSSNGSPNVSSNYCSSSSECSTLRSSFDEGMSKKLPRNYSKELRITSLTRDDEEKFLKMEFHEPRLVSCPPDFKNSSQESLDFIDKTPSKSSLALLPYCPPIQIDYDDFENVWENSKNWAILITEQNLNQHQPELVILPVNQEYDHPIPSPAVPLQKSKSFVTSQEILIPKVVNKINEFHYSNSDEDSEISEVRSTMQHFIQKSDSEDIRSKTRPNVQYAKVIKTKAEPKRLTSTLTESCYFKNQDCLPRNKTYRVEIQARISPPKDVFVLNRDTPDLIKNLDPPPLKRAPNPNTSTWVKCQQMCYSSRTLSSEDEIQHHYRSNPHCSDESLDELDLPMSSLSKDDQGINEAKQTQHFKTGIYAHWWMKANLQQHEEEPSLPKGHLGTWI